MDYSACHFVNSSCFSKPGLNDACILVPFFGLHSIFCLCSMFLFFDLVNGCGMAILPITLSSSIDTCL